MRTIDLNADLGEGMPWDVELLKVVTSANVSCGAHAGQPEEIAATLLEAHRRGVVVGAHPGWPDRDGFGRVEQVATREMVETLIVEQVASLRALADPIGVKIRYIKPHGALYNQAMRDDDSALPIVLGLLSAASVLALPLLGQPGSHPERLARDLSVAYVREGFPDRRYDKSLRLVPRSEANALIKDRDEAVAQAIRLVESGVDSLCIHGDSPDAVSLADAIVTAFKSLNITIRPFFAAT